MFICDVQNSYPEYFETFNLSLKNGYLSYQIRYVDGDALQFCYRIDL